MKHRMIAAGAAAVIMLGLGGIASETALAGDTRTEIALSEAERDQLLAGMRTYLESIQGIVGGLAENKLDKVSQSAKRSGAKLLQTVTPTTGIKLPVDFSSLSFDTHDKFDKLAERATRSASRGEVLSDLRDIMANCTTCHMAFRAVIAK